MKADKADKRTHLARIASLKGQCNGEQVFADELDAEHAKVNFSISNLLFKKAFLYIPNFSSGFPYLLANENYTVWAIHVQNIWAKLPTFSLYSHVVSR